MRIRSYAPCMIDCKQNPTLICALDHELQPSQHQRTPRAYRLSKIHSLIAAAASAATCRYWPLPLLFPTAACCAHRLILLLLAATNCILRCMFTYLLTAVFDPLHLRSHSRKCCITNHPLSYLYSTSFGRA